MAYKSKRDLPKLVRELKTLSPSELSTEILKRTNQERTPESIIMWFKRHPDVEEQLRKEIIGYIIQKEKEKEPQKRKMRRAHTKAYDVPIEGKCSICGSTKSLMRHHPNYDNPLNIITVCRKCHKKLHNGED